MSDDLVSRLLDDRHCNDWYLRQSAAQALTEARAEIERQADWIRRLQTALMFWMPGVDIRLDDATRELAADDAKLLSGYSGPLDCSCWGDEILARALAAESELSTLRARVREVVGPFAEICQALELISANKPGDELLDDRAIFQTWGLKDTPTSKQITLGHLRAARQLMEEVK